jgi:preprotein translocase subunit SecD
VANGAEARIEPDRDLVSREISIGGTDVLEVLVIWTAYDVDGSYLEKVEAGVDEFKNPSLVLRWNQIGRLRLAKLTGSNPPDHEGSVSRRLGIILDKRFYGTFPIHTELSDSMDIRGVFREKDLDTIAAVLNGGALLVPLRQVAKRVLSRGSAAEK